MGAQDRLSTTILDEQVMVGGSLSRIVTVKPHVLVLPEASTAVQMTIVTPCGKVDPLGGEHETVTPGQLSVAVAVKVTLLLEHLPGSVLAMMATGQRTLGSSLSWMVTVKLHELVLPEESVAVQVTVVTPLAKVEPLGGTQATVTPGQLSVAVAAKVTLLLEHRPESVFATILVEQVTLGGSLSRIVTVKLHELVLPEESVAVQVTVVTPFAKVEPLAGLQTRLVTAQLSEAVAVKVTLLLEHLPRSVFATMLVEQVTLGASLSRMVTVKLQLLELPKASRAVQFTVVTPFGKVEPLVGLQVITGAGSQSSTAVTLKMTLLLEHLPRSVLATMFDGQVMTGPVVSVRTVTKNEQ